MSQELELLNPLVEPGWDALIATHPEATFFHTKAWATVLHESYGHRPVYFVKRDGCQLISLVAVMEIDSFLLGRRGVSLPFTDYCPSLGIDDLEHDPMAKSILEHGRSRGWKSFECRSGKHETTSGHHPGAFFVHEIDLQNLDENDFMAGCAGPVRTAIRKGQKSGVKVEFHNSFEAVRQYYKLHCQTRERHGLPPQPYSFFRRVAEEIIVPRNGFVALASWQDQVVAGAVFFTLGKKAIYKYGASDAQYQSLRANNLLFFETVKRFLSQGCQTLNLGRTSLDNPGLRRFKQGLGAREETVAYWKYDLKKETCVESKDRAKGLHNTIFGLMPQSLSRLCGQILYKHVA